MPELPEVETLRRGLAEHLVGRRVLWIDVRLPKLIALGSPDDLLGLVVSGVRRRAKHLAIVLGPLTVLAHLRLAGQIVLRASDGVTLVGGGHPVPRFDAPLPHRSTHVMVGLDDGATMYVTDIRQFARLWVLPTDEADHRLATLGLGPEPLEAGFTRMRLAATLAGRRGPLKPLLLDQRLVAGLGNIYVDEALWRAQLHPARAAGTVGTHDVARLHRAIRSVLRHAITHGVAQVLDGRAAPGTDFPAVHGREGQPCPHCRTTILKTRLGGRGTYTCPRCQPSIADRHPASPPGGV